MSTQLWVLLEGSEATWGVAVWGPARLPPPQPQHSHLVIQQLLSHLDANSRSAATVRAGIVEVLSEAAVIAATGSVGKLTEIRKPDMNTSKQTGHTAWGKSELRKPEVSFSPTQIFFFFK